MAKQTVVAHVFMEHDHPTKEDGQRDWSRTIWAPTIWKCRVDDEDDCIYIGAQTVTVEVPDNFNPVPAQVAALEAEKSKALAAYQKTVADINERLSKLLAITHEA
jgi:hypothetical protein